MKSQLKSAIHNLADDLRGVGVLAHKYVCA